jgi:hypothetical protein
MRKGFVGAPLSDAGDGSILVKSTNSTTYNLLLRKAEKEGRLGGAHRCPICGMRFHTSREAESCCEKVRER